METAYQTKQEIGTKATGETTGRVAKATRLNTCSRHPQAIEPNHPRMGEQLPYGSCITHLLYAGPLDVATPSPIHQAKTPQQTLALEKEPLLGKTQSSKRGYLGLRRQRLRKIPSQVRMVQDRATYPGKRQRFTR